MALANAVDSPLNFEPDRAAQTTAGANGFGFVCLRHTDFSAAVWPALRERYFSGATSAAYTMVCETPFRSMLPSSDDSNF